MKKIRKLPLVTIVGAGPGDEELITVKGLKAIQRADVIIYDALVNIELLKHAPDTSLFIYVGKRGGKRSTPQDLINECMWTAAQDHGHVVRLKGGDPFVFGRGYEEYAYLRERNIPVTIVAGISSCIAVPEMEKVPVTHRGVSQSFWVLTATASFDKLATDLHLAIQSSATIVILMGRRKLEQISQLYIENGKGTKAVMIVQNGTLRKEKKSVYGSMMNIAGKADEAGIEAPCIIVIGDVVRLENQQNLEHQMKELYLEKQTMM